MPCQEYLEDLTTKEKMGFTSSTCPLLSVLSCSKQTWKKLKFGHHCVVSRRSSGALLGSQTSKWSFAVWGASLFLSSAIKEHHQEDKDFVKDMSVNDMRRWKQRCATHLSPTLHVSALKGDYTHSNWTYSWNTTKKVLAFQLQNSIHVSFQLSLSKTT